MVPRLSHADVHRQVPIKLFNMSASITIRVESSGIAGASNDKRKGPTSGEAAFAESGRLSSRLISKARTRDNCGKLPMQIPWKSIFKLGLGGESYADQGRWFCSGS